MPLMISKVDKKLIIPPLMRGIFPNETQLIINLPAEVPVEVPQYVLDYYTKNRKHVYRAANQPKPVEPPLPTLPLENKFDPVEWLSINYQRIDEAIDELGKRELFAVAIEGLKLRLPLNTGEGRLKERIIQDVKVKNAQQEELEKHEGVN